MNAVGYQPATQWMDALRARPFLASLCVAAAVLCILMTAQSHWLAFELTGHLRPVTPWFGMRLLFEGRLPVSLNGSGAPLLAVPVSFGCFVMTFKRLRANRPVKAMHGTASWADFEDVQQMGLADEVDGRAAIFVGGFQHGQTLHYLRHTGPQHLLLVAPTRSGKGVAIILPTLLSWTESMLVTDMKGELWAMTAGWRHRHAGQRVFRFDLSDPQSARFNPLSTIRLGTQHVVGDAQNIATSLVDPEGRGMDGRDGHWRKAAHALMTGLIVYAAEIKRREDRHACLADVADLLSPTDRSLNDVLKEICNCDSLPEDSLRAAQAAARVQLRRSGEESDSVVSTTINYLQLFQDPLIARATSACDFDWETFTRQDSPATVYLVANPDDKDRTYPVMRLVITSLLRRMTRELSFEKGRAKASSIWQVLFLMDEFTAFGRLDIFANNLAFMASYGLRAMIVVQDYSQLWSTYGKDESITSNCHIKVAFAPNKPDTAEFLSKLVGTTTIVKREKGGQTYRIGAFQTFDDRYSETRRPLATADEIMRMPGLQMSPAGQVQAPGRMLIFIAGEKPLLGTQPLYFADPYLAARAAVAAPASAVMTRVASHAAAPRAIIQSDVDSSSQSVLF